MAQPRKKPSEGGLSTVALQQYSVAKIHELLWAAAGEIEFRGEIAVGVHYDPHEDLVDAFGAICLAAGGDPKKLLAHGDDLEKVLPPASIPRVQTAVDAVEGWFDQDITTWSDNQIAADVAAKLRFVAEKISIACRQPM